MKASDLEKIIKIYSLNTTQSDFGLTENRYVLKCTCRARVNYSSGNRTVENDEIYYSVDREFIVRSYVPVTYDDIIKYDNQYWQVLSIDHSHDYNNIIIRTTKTIDSDPLSYID